MKKIKEDRFTFSATKYNFPIQRALSIDNQNLSHCLNEDKVKQRSQDLEEFFHDAGQFYWGTAKAWFSKKNIR